MDEMTLPECTVIGVGVSGGADSLFLTVMLKEWAKEKGIKLIALTVNHNLRAEAVAEAKHVARQMKKYGIEHHILTYTGEKPTSRIEEKARNIRYTLLQNFCDKHNILCLCLAHHSDDQAETFFARLARGSGLDGLCAIHPVSKRGKLTLIRPLLTLNKTDILDTLKAKRLTWAEDPMNQDETFERVRWRKQLTTLWQTGLTKAGLLLTAKRLQRAKQALDFYTDLFWEQSVQIDNRGFAKINVTDFKNIPLEIRLRVLAKALEIIGQSGQPISMEALEKALTTMKRRFTLAHCHVITHRKLIFIAKEYARQEKEKKVPAKRWTQWDRFRIWCDVDATIYAGTTKKTNKNIPYLVQQSFPIIEIKKTLEKNQKLDYNLNSSHIKTLIEFVAKKDI